MSLYFIIGFLYGLGEVSAVRSFESASECWFILISNIFLWPVSLGYAVTRARENFTKK